MKKLAIIGGGRMACIFAQNAREMNIETYCFSLEEGIVNKEVFDHIYFVDILQKEEVLKICQSLNIDGVVATTEITIAVASYVANKMNIIGIPVDIAEVITDKYRNRIVTSKIEGLKHPHFKEVNSIKEIKELNFTYPIILKPTSKGGKRGISVIYKETEIDKAFEYALQDSNNALPLIVEEYIEGGTECSVESLSYNGKNYIIQITEKITSGAPHCVELAHHQPARISENEKIKIEKVLSQALLNIGLTNGPCHTEIKIKNGEIYLIEFNARPGGDHIAYPLTELSTGYPYIRGAIEIALNQFKGVDKSKFIEKYAGVIFITKQTAELQYIFNHCENYRWLYEKHVATNELQSIIHNDGYNFNYFIYCDDSRPLFVEKEI